MRVSSLLLGALLGWTGNAVVRGPQTVTNDHAGPARRGPSSRIESARTNRSPAVAVDYDSIVRAVIAQLDERDKARASAHSRSAGSKDDPTVIQGDLIVRGRLAVGGAPEPGTAQPVTIHGTGGAGIFFVANEALRDPQRDSSQHRHLGSIGVSQDGGLRFSQNSICYSDARGCVADDKKRRVAYAGYDSMGDMSFYLANVDSTTGAMVAPNAQSLVFRLIDWDGQIHIVAHRAGQKIFFNASTKQWASDLQWEIPFPAAAAGSPPAK